MNRVVVGLLALALLLHSPSAAKGDYIYEVEQKGTLVLEFTTPVIIVGGTGFNPFSNFQLVPSGFATSGVLDGESHSKLGSNIDYQSFDRSSRIFLQFDSSRNSTVFD